MRSKLSEKQVLELFSYRWDNEELGDDPLVGKSDALSFIYKISPKAIRDIWNRRTWMHVTTPDYKEAAGSDVPAATSPRQQNSSAGALCEQSVCSQIPANPVQFDSTLFALQSSMSQHLGKRAREEGMTGACHTVQPLENDWLSKRARDGSFSDLSSLFSAATSHGCDLQHSQASSISAGNLSYVPGIQASLVHGQKSAGAGISASNSLAATIANLQRSLAATTRPAAITAPNGMHSQQPQKDQHAAAQHFNALKEQADQSFNVMNSRMFVAPKPPGALEVTSARGLAPGSTNTALTNWLELLRSSASCSNSMSYSVSSTPTFASNLHASVQQSGQRSPSAGQPEAKGPGPVLGDGSNCFQNSNLNHWPQALPVTYAALAASRAGFNSATAAAAELVGAAPFGPGSQS